MSYENRQEDDITNYSSREFEPFDVTSLSRSRAVVVWPFDVTYEK